MFFQKATTVTKIEAELQTLAARRPKLHSQLTAAEAALESALGDRRDLLIGDDSDNASARAAVEKRVLGAERDIATYSDAIAAIDAKIADAKQRLAAARDADAREIAAKRHDATADGIEKLALRLDRAVDELVAAADSLRDAIDPALIETRLYRNFFGLAERPLDPFEAVRFVLAEGLFSRAPELFVIEAPDIGEFASASMQVPMSRPDGSLCFDLPKHRLDGVKFLTASGALERSLVTPLRRAAQEIREGKRSPHAAATPGAPKTIAPAPL